MATRSNTFILKRSNVSSKIPPISGLTIGELALNTADAKLYTLYTGGATGATEVRQIGWDKVDTFVTGFTFSANTLVISQNQGQLPLTASISTIDISNIFSAVTFNIGTTGSISATTFYGSGSGLTGIPDYYVTGGTFNSGTNTLTLNRQNGSVSITGFTSGGISVDNYVTGGTYNNGTLILNRQNGSTNVTGFSQYFISGSTPTGVVLKNGDRWYNTNVGIELVYIDDGDSSQWVQPPNTPGPPGYSNLMTTSSVITSAATLSIDTNYYGVNYNGDVNITLPNPSGHDGYNINIKDEGGYASIYRIRLTPISGLIDGNTYVDMNLNYMSLHIVARNNNWWII